MTNSISPTENDIREAEKVLTGFSKEKTAEDIFYHLCFVICVPQTTWKKTKAVIEELRSLDFYNKPITQAKLEKIVKPVRFYRRKAQFVQDVKRIFPQVLALILEWQNKTIDEYVLRNMLVRLIRGLGYKTASQFIRNLGGIDLAIIDTHVLKYMGVAKISSSKEYLILEQRFRDLAHNMGMAVAVLDCIIWQKYSNTAWDNFIY